jgi:glycosyltransferase involved in cell wall biosynthesis
MHLYYAVRYPLEAWHERRLFRRCDRVLSVSEADRRYHARFVGDEASLYLPNYVNEAWYHLESPVLRDAGTVVMAGNFGAFQNQAGACWFVDRVWPMVQRAVPAARLQLVGDAPASWRGRVEQASGVTCVGRVPSVTPFLRRTTVGVVPLLHGSGTRFKILEALACELPLVSTTTGAEGIALVDGVHARLADTPAAFAQAVVELLTDDVQRQTLAGNGLALLRAEYSFEVNTERLRQIVLSLAR